MGRIAVMTKPVRNKNLGGDKPVMRVLLGDVIAMGPGKAKLLEAIADTGSISSAARKLGMSYRRAWVLVDTMNRCFRKPLVATATGGAQGGGCELTDEGVDVLHRYRAIEKRAENAVRKDFEQFAKLLKPRPSKSQA